MKTIKTYKCKCGEDFYEDDAECPNCRIPVDRRKFKKVEVVEITKEKMSNEKYMVNIETDSSHTLYLCITHNGSQWSSIRIVDAKYEIPKIIEVLQKYLKE